MEQRKYDLATARALFELVGFPDSWEVKDDGIFVTDEYRALSPKDEVFDWIPAYDMDWPSAPNPMTAPVLPIPFTASELAACMLDGCGRGIQDAVDSRIGYALNGQALNHFNLGSRWVREALQSAYSLAEKAQAEVGTFDYDEERKAYKLQQQAEDAEDEANTREGVFEKGISRDEANRRRRTAIASVAELKARAQQSNAGIKGKWFAWRKAMVHHLLQPQQAETQADTEPEVQVPASELPAQRRARWLAMLEEEEKRGKRGALQRLADREGVDRSNMRKDIEKARAIRTEQNRSGFFVSQLVQDGKRKV